MKNLLKITLVTASFIFSVSIKVAAQTTDTSKQQMARQKPKDGRQDDCCCETPTGKICDKDPETVEPIILDFKTKRIVLPKEIYKGLKKPVTAFANGDAFQVRIINYNPFLYKVLINSADSSTPVPKEGKLFDFFLDPSNISTVVAGLISNMPVAPAVLSDEQKSLRDANTGTIESFRADMGGLGVNTEVGKTKKQKEEDVETIISAEISTLENHNNEVLSLRNEINQALYETIRTLQSIQKTIPECKSFQEAIDIEQVKDRLLPFMERISDIGETVSNDLNRYIFTSSKYRTTIENQRNYKYADSLLVAAYSLLKQDIVKLQGSFSFETIEKLLQKIEMISQASSCYTSLPIFLQKDISKIKIELLPRFDSTSLQPYKTEFFLPWVQRRIWGISGGIYGSFIHNDIYAIRTNSSPASYTLIKENTGGAEIGINALAYTAWRTSNERGKNNYWGLAFGPGLSFESKPKPRVLFGVAYVNGEKNRLMISLGVTSGFVNKLSKVYEDGTPYTTQPVDFLRSIPRTSAFLSINYSFM